MVIPELSIIIPTLDEAETLPGLLGDLLLQQRIRFEVVIADGGSLDATVSLADEFFDKGLVSGVRLAAPRGRGRQLNAGVMAAQSDWILLLHADSRLHDVHQLRKALDFICHYQQQNPSFPAAGRFALKFDTQGVPPHFGFFYGEAKARLGRPGCIHGDQGYLLSQSLFHEVGPFREDLPVMEDTCMAEAIRGKARWLLLPGTLVTSTRRFQAEGFKARQTLNALMMNFLTIGWMDFFETAPKIYRRQDHTHALQLLPFFFLIRDLLRGLPFPHRCRIWIATGGYVRSQIWQIGLALDCRKELKCGYEPGQGEGKWLKWFDQWLEPLTNHLVGRLFTAMLVRIWFFWQLRVPDKP